MRIVAQRVSRAQVRVDDQPVATVGRGLLLLVAVEREDDAADVDWTVRKVSHLRIFEDDDGKMNLDPRQVGGEILAVSQFTLAGSLRRGNRPSFGAAARPEEAEPLFDRFVEGLRGEGLQVATGIFGAHMAVELVNDGPVTLIVDSRERRSTRSGDNPRAS
jgi:D-aminoacyl-tRNA deacylase